MLFDSGTETDALSPDFVRACHIPLLELPSPLVLQMGTKGSHSCVYYGMNVNTTLHGINTLHYFDIRDTHSTKEMSREDEKNGSKRVTFDPSFDHTFEDLLSFWKGTQSKDTEKVPKFV